MKKHSTIIIETILVSCLFIFLLVGCGGGGGNNELFNNNGNTPSGKSSQSTNINTSTINSPSKTSKNGDDSEVLDESSYPDFVFSIGNFLKPAGSVTVKFSSNPVSSPNVTVPAKVKINGEVYNVFDDSVEPGLGYKMGVESITLSEGFKQLSFGFNQDMNLKTVKIPSSLEKITCHILVGCVSFEKIVYNGTKAQWEAIQKDEYWNYLAKAFIVVCKDGNIEIPAWE